MRFDIVPRIEDGAPDDIRPPVKVIRLAADPVHGGDPEAASLRVLNPPVTNCFGSGFGTEGWRVTFSSDTRKIPPPADIACGSDKLVRETLLAEGIESMTAQTPNASRLRLRLMASHTQAADSVDIIAVTTARRLVRRQPAPSAGPGAEPFVWLAEVNCKMGGEDLVGEDGMELRRYCT